MGLFSKQAAGLVGDAEARLSHFRNNRDVLARKLEKAAADRESASAAWQLALDSDDCKVLEKAGGRLSATQELAGHLEAALTEHDQRTAEAEIALAAAKGRAQREAKADIIDKQAQSIAPIFDEYAALCARFAGALGAIELFDATAAASIVQQIAESVQGAKPAILDQMRQLAAELRRDPVPRAAPMQLPAGAAPRGFFPERNDPHPPQVWSGNRAVP